MNAAVFLDRDNTIIRNDGDLGDPDKVELIQGAASAIASLCGLGYRVVVITNQGGVARGKYGPEVVDAVHERIKQLVESKANGARIERFYFCPYHPDATVERYRRDHEDRKPGPGMLLRAAEELRLDLPQSWTIGDQMRDVQAGQAAGTRTVLLRDDADRLEPLDLAGACGAAVDATAADGDAPRAARPDFIARNLVEAVRLIAQQRKPDPAEELRRSKSSKRWDAAAVARLQRPRGPGAGPTEGPPAEPDASASRRPASEPPTPRREFRPWNAPAPRTGGRPAHRHPTREPAPPEPTEPGETAPAPPGPDASADESRTHQASPVEAPRAVPPRDEGEAGRETIADKLASARSGGQSGSDKTLRLILQELRSQRGQQQRPFSQLTLVAIILQLVAAVCLLGGLWMGAGHTELFVRWLGAGLMVQLATIAMLLFARPS